MSVQGPGVRRLPGMVPRKDATSRVCKNPGGLSTSSSIEICWSLPNPGNPTHFWQPSTCCQYSVSHRDAQLLLQCLVSDLCNVPD